MKGLKKPSILLQIRETLGLTQQQFANELFITPEHLCNLEKKRAPVISKKLAYIVAHKSMEIAKKKGIKLEITPDEILNDYKDLKNK